MIEVRTLGRAVICRDGKEVPGLAGHRQKIALLAYLGMEGGAAREELVALLWPERPGEKARHALSQALYAIRSELDEGCIQTKGDYLTVSLGACNLDAKELEVAAAAEDWSRVVEGYRGAFLEHFNLPGAPDFERWQSATRSSLARLARRAFKNILNEQTSAGELSEALATARHWVELEPLEDEAQHALIALLAITGDRSAALRRFQEYQEQLAAELEVEPLGETLAMVEKIRAGLPPEIPWLENASAPSVSEAAPSSDSPVEVEPPSPGSLPEEGENRPAPPPRPPEPRYKSLLDRLKGALVFQVAVVYLGAAWLLIQVTATLVDMDFAPAPIFSVVLYLAIAGFPMVVLVGLVKDPPQGGDGGFFTKGFFTGDFWPGWVRRVGPGHLVAVLSLALAVLFPVFLFLTRERPVGVQPTGVPQRVAVLYFHDNSESGELEHLADALTEDVNRILVQLGTLTVTPLNDVRPYRETGLTPNGIELLGLDTYLEGSVSGTQEELSVSLRLIDARSLDHIAAQMVEGRAGETFSERAELVERVADLLRAWLGGRVQLAELQEGTTSEEARRLVQRALQRVADARRLEESGDTAAAGRALGEADGYLEEAEEEDGSYLVPIVERGWVASQRAQLGTLGRSYDTVWTRVGLNHAERALRKERRHPGALELRGVLLDFLSRETEDSAEADNLRARAERDLRRATELDGTRTTAMVRLSLIYIDSGRLAEGKLYAETAYETDPYQLDVIGVLTSLCESSIQLQEWQEVDHWCGEGRRRFPEDHVFPSMALSALVGPEGPEPDPGVAWELSAHILRLTPPHLRDEVEPQNLVLVAGALARRGLADSARAVVERARSLPMGSGSGMDYLEANARLQLGEVDLALDLLELYLESKPSQRDFVEKDWWFEALRAHPRFQALVGVGGSS